MNKTYYTLRQVADKLKLHYRQVYHATIRGVVNPIEAGSGKLKTRLFDDDDVAKLKKHFADNEADSVARQQRYQEWRIKTTQGVFAAMNQKQTFKDVVQK